MYQEAVLKYQNVSGSSWETSTPSMNKDTFASNGNSETSSGTGGVSHLKTVVFIDSTFTFRDGTEVWADSSEKTTSMECLCRGGRFMTKSTVVPPKCDPANGFMYRQTSIVTYCCSFFCNRPWIWPIEKMDYSRPRHGYNLHDHLTLACEVVS